jgi:hypothetical protein
MDMVWVVLLVFWGTVITALTGAFIWSNNYDRQEAIKRKRLYREQFREPFLFYADLARYKNPHLFRD